VTAPTGFVGLTHLGIVSSIGWASLGGPVVAMDLDPEPVDALRAGRLPIHEPSLAELFESSRTGMTFSTHPSSLCECQLVIITTDIPTDEANASDTSVVLRLVDAVVPHLRDGATLAVMSQVPVGFTRQLAERIRKARPGFQFRLHYWVETLVIGNAVERYVHPERIIIGCDDPRAPLTPELAAGLQRFACPILPMSYESAELTKTAINLYLCASVTYANTLSDLCERVGADWSEVVPALRLDHRIGPAAYIRSGLGIAGGNLERDMVTLRHLCRSHDVDAAFIDTMLDCNARRPQWVHRALREHLLDEVDHPTIAVWGLAYKKNTRSTKNSVSVRVIRELDGSANVRAYDPLVTEDDVGVGIRLASGRDDALADADCLLVLTDWEEFAVPAPAALRSMRRRLIIDGVGIVDPSRADLAGVRLVQMGRPSRG